MLRKVFLWFFHLQKTMVNFLVEEEITEIDRISLVQGNEEEEFEYRRPDYVQFTMDFAENSFPDDLYKKALVYCTSLIVMHAFRNGNHRTSLYCAEHFLLKNDFVSLVNREKIDEIQDWRAKYEEEHDLERVFFQIAGIEDIEERREEIEGVMNSEYGLTIEKWLKENYKQN